MITQGVYQFECAESVKPGMHLPCELVRVLALPERMFKRLIRSDFLKGNQ